MKRREIIFYVLLAGVLLAASWWQQRRIPSDYIYFPHCPNGAGYATQLFTSSVTPLIFESPSSHALPFGTALIRCNFT